MAKRQSSLMHCMCGIALSFSENRWRRDGLLFPSSTSTLLQVNLVTGCSSAVTYSHFLGNRIESWDYSSGHTTCLVSTTSSASRVNALRHLSRTFFVIKLSLGTSSVGKMCRNHLHFHRRKSATLIDSMFITGAMIERWVYAQINIH